MINEETLRAEFEEWVSQAFTTDIDEGEEWYAWMGWRRAAIRFDIAAREEIIRMLADDALAMTFQSFGQYRTALIKAIRETIKE